MQSNSHDSNNSQHDKRKFQPLVIDPTQMFHSPLSTGLRTLVKAMNTTELVPSMASVPALGSNITVVVPQRPSPTDSVNDMSQSQMSRYGRQYVVRECVKRRIFPLLKFYDRDDHNVFSKQQDTVCVIVLHHAGMTHKLDAQEWWNNTKQLVLHTHTVHRNNVIKNIHEKYHGELLQLLTVFLIHAHVFVLLTQSCCQVVQTPTCC